MVGDAGVEVRGGVEVVEECGLDARESVGQRSWWMAAGR